jgi:hypothetical protein
LYGSWTADPTSGSASARWLSARLVRAGIKIIPSGSMLNTTGILTIG